MSTVYVDSGRAWGTVIGGFVANFLLGGLGKSYGLIKEAFQEVFNCGSALLLLAGGLIYTLMYCNAIVVHHASQRFGRRIVVFIGALGAFFSLLVAAFAPNITVWMIAIGFGVGTSLSCIYFSIFSVVGQCFHRYLGMANGLSVAGVSVGQMAFPALITYLDRNYGTRLSTTVIAAFCLHLTITAVLMPRYILNRRDEAPNHPGDAPDQSPRPKQTKKPQRRLAGLRTGRSGARPEKAARRASDAAEKPLLDRQTTTETVAVGDVVDPVPGDDEVALKTIAVVLPKVTAEGDNGQQQLPFTEDSVELVCVVQEDGGVEQQPASLTKILLVIYIVGKIFADIGDVSVSFIAPSHGNKLGLSQELVSYGIAFSGLFDLTARLGVGWLTDRPCCAGRRGLLLSVTWLIEGLNAMAFSQLNYFVIPNAVGQEPSTGLLIAYFFCFGIHGVTSGTAMTQMVVVLTDWVGKEKMPIYLAVTMFVLGLVIAPGQYAMGHLADVTGDYIISLQVCCLILLLGGISFLFEFPVRWFYKRRRGRRQYSVDHQLEHQQGLVWKQDDAALVPLKNSNHHKKEDAPLSAFVSMDQAAWDVLSSDNEAEEKRGDQAVGGNGAAGVGTTHPVAGPDDGSGGGGGDGGLSQSRLSRVGAAGDVQ